VVINTHTGEVIARLDLEGSPYEVSIAPDGAFAYVIVQKTPYYTKLVGFRALSTRVPLRLAWRSPRMGAECT